MGGDSLFSVNLPCLIDQDWALLSYLFILFEIKKYLFCGKDLSFMYLTMYDETSSKIFKKYGIMYIVKFINFNF